MKRDAALILAFGLYLAGGCLIFGTKPKPQAGTAISPVPTEPAIWFPWEEFTALSGSAVAFGAVALRNWLRARRATAAVDRMVQAVEGTGASAVKDELRVHDDATERFLNERVKKVTS